MEKFNFLRFAKISCLVMGLSSLTFTSCKTDEQEDGGDDPLNDLKFPVLTIGDLTATYPEGHNFGAWDQPDKIIHVGDYKTGHNDTFNVLLTMDKLSKNVRVSYYCLSKPEKVSPSEVDDLVNVFKDNAYCEDAGHELLGEETVRLANYEARKLTAMQSWAIDASTKDTIFAKIYKERYFFFDTDVRKVYTVEMEMPDSLKASRRAELAGIVYSVKVNKK